MLCEAVNPLIKQSAEEILHTLLNENKNKYQEENHHFIFSVSYGEIPYGISAIEKIEERSFTGSVFSDKSDGVIYE